MHKKRGEMIEVFLALLGDKCQKMTRLLRNEPFLNSATAESFAQKSKQFIWFKSMFFGL